MIGAAAAGGVDVPAKADVAELVGCLYVAGTADAFETCRVVVVVVTTDAAAIDRFGIRMLQLLLLPGCGGGSLLRRRRRMRRRRLDRR